MDADAERTGRQATTERLLELDQLLRDAIGRKDGAGALHAARMQNRALKEMADRWPGGDTGWMREAFDRLGDLAERAQAAKEALGAEIGGVGIQRKLMGPGGPGRGGRTGRSFQA